MQHLVPDSWDYSDIDEPIPRAPPPTPTSTPEEGTVEAVAAHVDEVIKAAIASLILIVQSLEDRASGRANEHNNV